MELPDVINAIHRKNFADEQIAAGVQQLLDEYGYTAEHRPPQWFIDMLELVADGKEGAQQFPAMDSDTASIILELRDHFGWPVDSYGEGIRIPFEASNVEVFISMEDTDGRGKWCCSFRVRRLEE